MADRSSLTIVPPPNPSGATLSALTVENVSIYYGHRKALEGVSLSIPDNTITAIIGPSGCGKSTFLKALNRIGELDSNMRVQGEVRFFGQDIYAPQVNLNRLRQQIGMVFQKPNPFPMSIYDNVAYGIRISRTLAKARLDAIVESSLRAAALWDEVKDRLNKPALGLSGGQQQRLCIARALAVRPKVLLMDEPCSALDPVATLKIESLMQDLKSEVTIVIVTHNMQQASRVSEMTAFFNADESRIGQLVEAGPTQIMFVNPNQAQTRDYVSGRFG